MHNSLSSVHRVVQQTKKAETDQLWFLLEHEGGRVRNLHQHHESMAWTLAGINISGWQRWCNDVGNVSLCTLIPTERLLYAAVHKVHGHNWFIMATSSMVMCHVTIAQVYLRLTPWTWQWILCTSVGSPVTSARHTSEIRSLNVQAVKSAAVMWGNHVNPD